MKSKHIVLFLLLSTVSTASFSQFLKNLGNKAESAVGVNPSGDFSQDEAARAIKEALTNGIIKGVDKVSVADGYFKNPSIKIPFPPEAQKVEDALRGIGLGNMVDDVVSSMNHAAENAAKAATTIFVNAIKQLTLNDAMNMVNNKQQDAATQFLKRTTTDQLVAAFKPSIKEALDKTGASKYWSDVMTRYNQIPFVSKVQTDLPEYATRKAIDGLFFMVAKEEAAIRKDPMARTSDLLKKVFGNAKM